MWSNDVVTSGALLSTNALLKVNCGFQPAFVHLVNAERGSEAIWNAGMPQDSMLRASGAATRAFVTTSGISTYRDSTGEGFTVGPGAPMNPTGSDPMYWLALRGTGPTVRN